MRRDHEEPRATGAWGWRFHHVGVPTRQVMPGEHYIEQFRLYVSGFPTSPYGIEWMRFEEGSPVHDLIKSVPHVAFVVEDLAAALVGKEVITQPNSPSDGLMVAMIIDNGCPIELMQFTRQESSADERRSQA